MSMVLNRGSQEYRVQNVTHVADDRYVGMIDEKVKAMISKLIPPRV